MTTPLSEGSVPSAVDLRPAATEHSSVFGWLDLLLVIAGNLRFLLLAPLFAGLIALAITFAIPPTFTAVTRLLPPQQPQSSAVSMLQSLNALGAVAAAGLKNPGDQYVALLRSTTVRGALVDRFKLMARYDENYREDAIKHLDRTSRVSSGKDGLITVEVDDGEPALAASVANAYVEELSGLMARLAVTEAQQRRLFFEKQLALAKGNLAKAEQALQATGVSTSILKASPQAAVESIARLRAQITAQEIRLASMRGYLTDSSAEFRQAQTELSALRAQLVRAQQEEPPVSSDSARNSDYIARYRDFKYHETLFDLFAKQYELARVDEAREGAVIQVVDVAQPPERKSKPSRALIAIATALVSGLVLLMLLVARAMLNRGRQNRLVAEKLTEISASLRQNYRLRP